MQELKIGPILFREEAIFRKEIKLEDHIQIDMELVKAHYDYSRWTLRHNFRKKDGTLAAIVAMDGAWIDIEKRRLTCPGILIQQVFSRIPLSSDYRMIERATPVLEEA
jgi:acyl-CoA thioester hydrolase